MGAVLVARGTQVLFSKGYGMANLEWNVPNTSTTKFEIASISKQFTAAAILLLEERGKLRVTEPIKSFLPDAPSAWDAITFHHLLSHTSGLASGPPPDPATRALPTRPEKLIERFRNLPLQSEPGTKYSYSNAGYQLLAYLIERTSGQPYEDFLRENIFEPLGMKESVSATQAPIISSRAAGYINNLGVGRGLSSSGRALLNAPFFDQTNVMGAGSLYSTTADLHRWTVALFGGKLLRPASLTKMTTPVDSGYAYGLAVGSTDGRRRFSHGGSGAGFSSSLTYYPESQVTIVVLANARPPLIRGEQPAVGVVSGWLGTLAHGGTVSLPTRR
jgi:CubicO group peptidase (beta-lactamase class C family)